MLSYQHAFHAGNAADVHKHALLASSLAYLTRKDKALSYFETHAGRGLYDLSDTAARRTGEAVQGVARLLQHFSGAHPYPRLIADLRVDHGPAAYPGSPLIAARLLRRFDRIDLAELHPQEHAALLRVMPQSPNIRIHKRDGLEMANAMVPPDPRRGLMLIDPSWEVREDYATLARLVPRLHRKWGVGVIMLWYPVLADRRHLPMIHALRDALPDIFVHEVRFPPAREGHGMEGSGVAIVNPPWGLEAEAKDLSDIFEMT